MLYWEFTNSIGITYTSKVKFHPLASAISLTLPSFLKRGTKSYGRGKSGCMTNIHYYICFVPINCRANAYNEHILVETSQFPKCAVRIACPLTLLRPVMWFAPLLLGPPYIRFYKISKTDNLTQNLIFRFAKFNTAPKLTYCNHEWCTKPCREISHDSYGGINQNFSITPSKKSERTNMVGDKCIVN